MEYVSRSQSMVSLLVSAFVLTFAVIFGSLFMPHAAHAAAPTMTSSTITADTNADGTVDRITIFFSEATDLDDTGGAADGFTSIAFNSGCTVANGDYSGNGVLSKAFNVTGCATENTSITPTAAYIAVANCATNFSICDDAEANQMANGANRVSADGAGPVLISANPTNNKSGVNETANVTLTYSETPASWTGSITGGITLTSSINSSVVTLSHAAHFLTGSNTLTISTSPDAAGNAFAGAQTGDSTVASPLVFYVSSSDDGSSDDDASSSSEAYSITLLTPEDGDTLEAGDVAEITWSSTGTGASYVNLSYSVDGGDTWQALATNSLNDSSYLWTLPSVDSDEVMLKVVATDLALELATDTSAEFSITMPVDTTEDETSDDEEDSDEEDVPSEIDGVVAGDYVKAEDGSTIYYVDSSMKLRPFFDEQTYFTYEDTFNPVITLSSGDLADFSLGAPMLPKAGAVLVKIQSVAKVYMVEETSDGSYSLRWITSEDVATDMFGSSWSSYVVDVDATLFTRYEEGDDVDSAEDVDVDIMKYRTELHD